MLGIGGPPWHDRIRLPHDDVAMLAGAPLAFNYRSGCSVQFWGIFPGTSASGCHPMVWPCKQVYHQAAMTAFSLVWGWHEVLGLTISGCFALTGEFAESGSLMQGQDEARTDILSPPQHTIQQHARQNPASMSGKGSHAVQPMLVSHLSHFHC